MVNPSTESILNQMTNLAMDIAMDYVLPASPMSDVGKSDLYEFEREVVAAVNDSMTGGLMGGLVATTLGTVNGCCGRPPTDLCKKNSYMGASGCDSCFACRSRQAAAASSSSSSSSSSSNGSSYGSSPSSTIPHQQAETTMDISWCQFDGCEFDTADNSYLDICDWIFYADRYALTEENRQKVQKAFQMVPPGDVTGYVAESNPQKQATDKSDKSMTTKSTTLTSSSTTTTTTAATTISTISNAAPGGITIKSEPDDDYLWTSDNHLLPIILKAEPDADILQITELDHSYLQSGTNMSSANSSTAVSPIKHHHHPNHLEMLGLVTPPPSRSQSSEEEEIDVVNDSWDTPDTPRKGATMADIMKRGIVKKREPPVTKWKNTVKRKHKTSVAATYPMPPPPPKKLCGGLSLMDRFKKDTNWKSIMTIKQEPIIKEEPIDDDYMDPFVNSPLQINSITLVPPKLEPLDDGDVEGDDEYDVDADFESLMKNETDDLFDDDFDDYDDENDVDWDKVFRYGSNSNDTSSSSGRGRGHSKSSGGSSSCSSSTTSAGPGRKKKKKKKTGKSSKQHHHQQQQQQHHHHHHHNHHHHQSASIGKKVKFEPGTTGGGSYNYKTKLMDPVKRALHNDLEKSRRVETSMLFMNLSMQVSFLDDNRKIPSKLSILRGAKRECDLMMLDERRLLSEKHVMQQKQRMLRERLFELRREHYHRRYGKNNNPKQQ